MARLPFIDVGDSQGSVDWDRVRTQGKAVLAACKATEGETFRAKTFSGARVKAIHKAGLPLMPYQYLPPARIARGVPRPSSPSPWPRTPAGSRTARASSAARTPRW
jgi:hypothetical protein